MWQQVASGPVREGTQRHPGRSSGLRLRPDSSSRPNPLRADSDLGESHLSESQQPATSGRAFHGGASAEECPVTPAYACPFATRGRREAPRFPLAPQRYANACDPLRTRMSQPHTIATPAGATQEPTSDICVYFSASERRPAKNPPAEARKKSEASQQVAVLRGCWWPRRTVAAFFCGNEK